LGGSCIETAAGTGARSEDAGVTKQAGCEGDRLAWFKYTVFRFLCRQNRAVVWLLSVIIAVIRQIGGLRNDWVNGSQIAIMQAATSNTIDRVEAIQGTIDRIAGIVKTVDGTIGQQAAATHEIGQVMQQAGLSTQAISSDFEELGQDSPAASLKACWRRPVR
jgi:hypothetical protein